MGRRPDLVGGGLIRSAGGWAAVKGLRAAMKFQKSDERILWNSDFVESVFATNAKALKRKYDLQSKEIDLDEVSDQVAKLMFYTCGSI